MSVSTVSFTIKKRSETVGRGLAEPNPQQSEDKFLRVNSLCDRRLTGQQLQAQLHSGRSKQVSVSTVKRRLGVAGLTARVAARQPLLKMLE